MSAAEPARSRLCPHEGERVTKVAGRVALVTGAGSGLGECIARRLAESGASVVINDVVAAEAERVAGDITRQGGQALAAAGSVTSADDVEKTVQAAADRFGRLDILVNNAGIGRNAALHRLTDADWDAVLAVNLKGVFLCSRAAVRLMREQRYGRIINIASRAWLGWYGQANYAASKGGVVSLTRTLAIELAGRGITANAIAPGQIETPLTYKENPPEVIERLLKAQPTGRFGTPEDVAWAALFFASDSAGYITGQTLYVCGGKSIYSRPDPT
ncbi:MAG: glucose 1-dehydrogenase [Chloroflexota bacterium]|nr:glucose 1-dehydrogenase [Chloroflexota bacterium]